MEIYINGETFTRDDGQDRWVHHGCGGSLQPLSNNCIDVICSACRLKVNAMDVDLKLGRKSVTTSNQAFHTTSLPQDFAGLWPTPVVIHPELAKAFDGMSPEQIKQMAEVAGVVKKMHPNGGATQSAPDSMIEAVDAARKATP